MTSDNYLATTLQSLADFIQIIDTCLQILEDFYGLTSSVLLQKDMDVNKRYMATCTNTLF